MKGCNKLEYVNLNISKLKYLIVDFSDCKALTGASWNDKISHSVTSWIDFTNCFNLDQQALLHQHKTDLYYQLRLSGEEVPSYFTHRTTGTCSSLTIPLLQSSLSQPFFRFRACIVFNCDSMYNVVEFHFKGRFWNSFDSFGQPQDFRVGTEMYAILTDKKDSRLFILDCRISLRKDSAKMNYNHVDIQIHISHALEEWGIRLLEENRLGNPKNLDEDNMLNEAEECGGKDAETETRSKRMRIL